MTDQNTIDDVTSRLRGDIVIHEDLLQFRVVVDDDVTIFPMDSVDRAHARNSAREFARRRRSGTGRQIREMFEP